MISEEKTDRRNCAEVNQEDRHAGQSIRMAAGFGLMSAQLARRSCIMLTVILLFIGFSGCGTAFTGGGVPDGHTRLYGTVVSASSPLSNLQNVTVNVQVTPRTGVPVVTQARTGSDGAFNFQIILPQENAGNVQVTATPDDPGFRSQKISFTAQTGHTNQLIVALPSTSLNVANASSVSITGPSNSIHSGDTAGFTARVLDENGKSLQVIPTLLFDGNFATISSDQTIFISPDSSQGSGSITAYWYGLATQTTSVMVNNNAPQLPPPAPVLLNGVSRVP